MTVPHKNTFRFSAIPVKSPMAFFTELKPKKSQFWGEYKRPQRAKAILRKKNDAEEICLPDFRLYYKATVIKHHTVLAQKQTYRSVEQTRKPRNKATYLWSIVVVVQSLSHV